MNHAQLHEQFIERYGPSDQPIRSFFAPGRVNLIGDHTDYNGGLVFPCAIEYGTTLLIRPTDAATFQLASTNFDLIAVLSSDQTNRKYGDHWINYPLGVLQQFLSESPLNGGFECLYSGNVPNGAGLSSSAAISVVTSFAINALFNCGHDLLTLVKMARRAENDFVGVQCGIMDQYAVAFGEQNHAMQLDCESLRCEQVPLTLGDYRIVLINTNQRRELSESLFNQRVTETSEALSGLAAATGASTLANVTPEQLNSHTALLADNPVLLKRARHVVSEHQRVIHAVDALRHNNLARFGELMLESHASLRDDYCVSSEPLDTLVELASDSQGVLGARLTGAGFGGCTVNLVHADQLAAFEHRVGQAYQQRSGLSADFYTITPSQGVRELMQ